MRIYETAALGFKEFGRADTGGGYDWTVFAVYTKDGEFFWASDSGCSCYGEFEGDDFPGVFEGPGNAHEAIKALHSWSGDQYTVDGSGALLAKLLDYKPKDAK